MLLSYPCFRNNGASLIVQFAVGNCIELGVLLSKLKTRSTSQLDEPPPAFKSRHFLRAWPAAEPTTAFIFLYFECGFGPSQLPRNPITELRRAARSWLRAETSHRIKGSKPFPSLLATGTSKPFSSTLAKRRRRKKEVNGNSKVTSYF